MIERNPQDAKSATILEAGWTTSTPPQAPVGDVVLVAVEGPLESEMEARAAQGVPQIIV